MKKFLHFRLILLVIFLPLVALCQQITVKGTVITAEGNLPLAGASVVHKASLQGTTTDSLGHFSLNVSGSDSKIIVSFIGYLKKEVTASSTQPLLVSLTADPSQLGELVVSSGYQNLPAERVTGSFSHLDNRILSKRVSPDLISRLADNVPGLIFNRSGTMRQGAQSAISIRGQNTIFGREDPLVVLDNFPFTGDLSLINPNDIENVTILKDAAAASIWGAQSSNGVIVITTKQGMFNQRPQISVNSNVTVGKRPDLYYLPVMSTTDYIDMERTLFERGFYKGLESNALRPALTPVVELLIARRDGKISEQQAEAEIGALTGQDLRADLSKYLYQSMLNQQYNLSVRGGSLNHKYFLSGGFDKNMAASRGDDYTRATINASNTLSLLKDKLDITASFFYARSGQNQNSLNPASLNITEGKPLPPYVRLADQAGNPVFIPHIYRDSFIQQAMQEGLLDWRYSPQQEIALADNKQTSTDYRLNLNTAYRLSPAISVQLLYQYNWIDNRKRNRQSKDSWYTRDLINRFSFVGPNGTLTRPVPVGDVLDINTQNTRGQSVRAQLDYNKEFTKAGSLTLLAGAEIRGVHSEGYSSIYYGFDNEIATNVAVDYLSYFRSYVNPASAYNRIPYYGSITDLTDRYISYYGNGAYTYLGRYTISASARLDQSNLFGVKANQRGVPLYSAGISWKLAHEPFYSLSWLPHLNLRATFGYNGNIDKSLSAYTTALYLGTNSSTGLQEARVLNPPNSQLRWERTRIINLGIDFKSRSNRLQGNIEYYFKNGIDLIGDAPLAPQTGMSTFRGNTASTKGQGLDLNITSENLLGFFGWQTTLLASYAADKVSSYLAKPALTATFLSSNTGVPAEGRPLYAMYSYRWAGLDPATGDPQGYLGSEISKNYNAIRTSATLEDLNYHGRKRPVFFGAIRNTFTFKGLSVSANISYRLGYYVRRPSLSYETVLQGQGGHGDFGLRWQKPGDELLTRVPSMPAALNTSRDDFYSKSAALVKKGNHLRFQDINLSYTLTKSAAPWLFASSVRLYLYAENIGLLSKKIDGIYDPDYLTSAPPPRSFSAGLNIDF